MKTADVIVSQYLAALDMLAQTLERCPAKLWNSPADKTRFWHVAYHTLFYTHLYLSESTRKFRKWSGHRPDHHLIAASRRKAGAAPLEPYDKESLLEYLAFCRRKVAERVPQLKLQAPSGFGWLPFTKLELQLYNLRHLQQHTGELMERIGSRAGVDIDWVAKGKG